MFEDFFRYKKHFLTVALVLSYAFMHTKLTGVYLDVTLDKLTDFTARLPFGQRLLVPFLVHYLQILLPLQIDNLYFLMECVATGLLSVAINQLLQLEFSQKPAQLLTWLFLLLLPLVTIINYRLSVQGEAPFFYPYDTPTLFFMALGLFFCLRQQWLYFLIVLFFATLNRESSFLLIALLPALYWQRLRQIYKPLFLAIVVYLLARGLVLSFLSHTSGSLIEWFFRDTHYTHFEINFRWLFEDESILLFLFCFAGLPLFWFVFYDYIALIYRPLRYVALIYFMQMMLVGNFFEARIFCEIIILLYLPVCIAISRWLLNEKPIVSDKPLSLWYFIDRYVILSTLFALVVFCQPINKLVSYLISLQSG